MTITKISRTLAGVFQNSDSFLLENPKEPRCPRQQDSVSVVTRTPPTPAVHASIDAHEYFARLGDYFVVKFGDRLATVKAQMVFDACGPGRDIDPQSLFLDDSDGDSWAEAIESMKL